MNSRNPDLESQLLADALSGRISRRQVLQRAAVLGLSAPVVATLLAACVPGDEPAVTPTPAPGDATPTPEDAEAAETPVAGVPQVARNRTLIVMQGGDAGHNPEFASFNNQVTGANFGWHSGPLQTMAEPLIMFNVLAGDYENWLAEDWEYNDDFTEITMTLREGIEWGDGTPFTAEDVAFTYNTVRDHQDEVVHGAEIHFLREAIAEDERTVRFVLTGPNPRWWATTLTSNHGVTEHLIPKHVWEGQDFMTFTFYDPAQGWPFSTGPYRLTSTSAEQKVFDRRDDWWAVKTGFRELPQVERVIYIPNRDETLSAQMIITDEIDMSRILSVPTLQSVFAQNPEVITFTHQEPPYGYLDWCPIDLGMNNDVEPWSNRDLRWAINFAIDRERLVSLAEGGAGVPALHQFTPYEWFAPFEEALQPIYAEVGLDKQAHPERTEELMTGLGYTANGQGMWVDGAGQTVKMNIHVPEFLRAYGPPLTQQLRDGGFDAEFDMSPGLGTLVQTGEHPVALGCKGPSGVKGMDPYFMLSIYTSQFYRPTGQPAPSWWATSRWRNEEYDAIVQQLDPLEVEDPRTLELFVEAMRIWLRELPAIFVAQLIIRYPMSQANWTGWPTEDDIYGFPHSWQHEFLKTIIRLEPTS